MSTLISSHNGEHETGRCDAKCYNATGGTCDCICGGMNHGVGQKKAEANTMEYVDLWCEKWKVQHPHDKVKLSKEVIQQKLF